MASGLKSHKLKLENSQLFLTETNSKDSNGRIMRKYNCQKLKKICFFFCPSQTSAVHLKKWAVKRNGSCEMAGL